MRNLIGAIAVFTLCFCVPVGATLAAPIAAAAAHSVMHLTSHSDSDHQQSDNGISRQHPPINQDSQKRNEGRSDRYHRYFDWRGSSDPHLALPSLIPLSTVRTLNRTSPGKRYQLPVA